MSCFYDYIIWDLRPEVFSFSPLPRWYGVMWGVGVILSYQVMSYIYRKEGKTDRQFSDLTLFVLLGTLIGAHLGHVLFYDPIHYWNHPEDMLPFKFSDGFQLTGISGLASHGGGVGILIAIGLYCKKHNLGYLWVADRLAIVAALTGAFIRLGNLFNSEIYGEPTSVSWAFVFSNVDQHPRHPTQLYEAIMYFVLFVLLFINYKSKYIHFPKGMTLGVFVTVLFTFRFIIEFLKVDQEVINYGLSINAGQILSLPYVIIGILLIVWSWQRSKTKLHL